MLLVFLFGYYGITGRGPTFKKRKSQPPPLPKAVSTNGHSTAAYKDLLEAIRPLGKASLSMELFPNPLAVCQGPPRDISRLDSKFGGMPYLASGESWPICPTCTKRLTFICQADLASSPWRYHLPSKARFFTFFFCQFCMPWGDAKEPEGQWVVRLYPASRYSPELLADAEPYFGPHPPRECLIEFRDGIRYPNECSLSIFAPKVCDISSEWPFGDWPEAYHRAINDLGGRCDDCSYVGGYPTWDQDHESYAPLDFFATIASEGKANVFIGGGHLNLFITTDGSNVPLMIRQCD